MTPQQPNTNKVIMEKVSRRTMNYTLDFMYTDKYVLPGGDIMSQNNFCNHYHAAFELSSPLRARITKRKCRYFGKPLVSWHLLPHTCVYMLADLFDMGYLKAYARQGVIDVLHVYWKDNTLKLRHALDLTFSAMLTHDRGTRDIFVDTMVIHPGLWADDCDVRHGLDEHSEVLAEVGFT